MKSNVAQNKSYLFALKIIKTFRYLSQEKREFVLSKQLLRSGTSIGANVEEAIGGQSKRDFLSKISISYPAKGEDSRSIAAEQRSARNSLLDQTSY